MKKIISLLLLLAVVSSTLFAFTSCGKSDDVSNIEKAGKLVVGITVAPPMNFKDDSGKWVGFDTEFTEAVCKRLGVTATFQVIDWNAKESLLKSGDIDCIWNGMTVTEDRRPNMDFSTNYMVNRQAVVAKKAVADAYDSADLTGKLITAEAGSAGEEVIDSTAKLKAASYTASDSQADALVAVKSGNFDYAVLDYTMASYLLASSEYSDLAIAATVGENEFYAIGFRKGSNLTGKVNTIIAEMISDGTLKAIATKYGLGDSFDEATAK